MFNFYAHTLGILFVSFKHRTMRAEVMRGRRTRSASNWENESNFPTQEFFESKPQLLKTFFHIKGVN